MKLLAVVEDPKAIRTFLTFLAEPTEPPELAPTRGPPWWKSRVLRRKYSSNLELFAS